jgi:hypothetical protein
MRLVQNRRFRGRGQKRGSGGYFPSAALASGRGRAPVRPRPRPDPGYPGTKAGGTWGGYRGRWDLGRVQRQVGPGAGTEAGGTWGGYRGRWDLGRVQRQVGPGAHAAPAKNETAGAGGEFWRRRPRFCSYKDVTRRPSTAQQDINPQQSMPPPPHAAPRGALATAWRAADGQMQASAACKRKRARAGSPVRPRQGPQDGGGRRQARASSMHGAQPLPARLPAGRRSRRSRRSRLLGCSRLGAPLLGVCQVPQGSPADAGQLHAKHLGREGAREEGGVRRAVSHWRARAPAVGCLRAACRWGVQKRKAALLGAAAFEPWVQLPLGSPAPPPPAPSRAPAAGPW